MDTTDTTETSETMETRVIPQGHPARLNLNIAHVQRLTISFSSSIVHSDKTYRVGEKALMTRAGTLLEKKPGLRTIFQGTEHNYVRCVIADIDDPERHFECRVLDEDDIPISIGEPIKLEVIKVVTERRSGIVRFDCRLIKTQKND